MKEAETVAAARPMPEDVTSYNDDLWWGVALTREVLSSEGDIAHIL
jgi:hypothetical protein